MLFNNLPAGLFNTLVIDPPWPQTMTGKRNRPRHHKAIALPYNTLTVEEIATFPLSSLCAVGAHVYLWCTNKTLPDAFGVLSAWGVRYHLCLPLVKRSGIVPCNGYVFGAEYCLLGFYGRPMQKFTGIGKLNWLETNPIPGQHSAKPDSFYSLVESMSPGPRVDLFARKQRSGWTCWGDEL